MLRSFLCCVGVLIAAACTGSVTDPGGATGAGASTGMGADPPPSGTGGAGGDTVPVVTLPPNVNQPPAACANGVGLGPGPMRRLSRVEYNNTVRDLLGETGQPANVLPPDARVLGFDNNALGLEVNEPVVTGFQAAAEALAATAVTKFATLIPCTPASDTDEACASKFIAEFGQRAFRRPLTDTQKARYLTLFKAEAQAGFAQRAQLVIEAMLQSPYFLYRPEALGGAAGIHKLDDWAVASRLSYLLWASMPDPTLLAAAAAGQLGTPANVAAQAERMLKDARARASVAHFHNQWLALGEIEGLTKNVTGFDASLYLPLFRQETERFLDHVVWDGEGTLAAMLTAPYTFANRQLGTFYGPNGGVNPAGRTLPQTFSKIEVDPTRRAGLLTQAGILAAHAGPLVSVPVTPVRRGVFVRSQILCAAPPPPPEDADTVIPAPGAGVTNRVALETKTSPATCYSCHQLLNDIGYAFENFDSIGRYRMVDNGQPVDAAGQIRGLDDAALQGGFVGAPALGEKLARSQAAADCVARQWFRYAFGRAETDADACSLALLGAGLSGAGGNVLAFLRMLTQVDAFFHVMPAGGPS